MVLLLFSVGLLFWHAWAKSPTYDEVSHIQCGYYHWQHHDFERGLEHTPLVRLWAALPLNFISLQDPEVSSPLFLDRTRTREILYGIFLVFKNVRVRAETIMIISRGMMILLTLSLFLLVGRWSEKLYGRGSGLLSLGLIATMPAFLAHGSLVTTDVGGVLAALCFLYLLSQVLETPSRRNVWFCGILLGIAQASKLSNLMLYPILLISLLFLSNSDLKFRFRAFLCLKTVLISLLILNLSYGFQNFLPPHFIHPEELSTYGWPTWIQFLYRWTPLPDFYLKSVGFMFYHVNQGFQTFFLGKIYTEGQWFYFPLLFLFKTPIASLLLLAILPYSFFKIAVRKEEWFLILCGFFVLAVSARAKLNLGIRHFLLFYPLCLVLAGRVLILFKDNRIRNLILGGLIVLQSLEVLLAAPHFLGFIHFAAGGPKNAIRIAADGDLGQDLNLLGQYLKQNPSEVVLSYFGTALPDYYGIQAQELLPTGAHIH
ncbi:MAG: glycosyltransferase family 39 protein, partial [Elusimicrobia bacterium]|nr:glycosyltransferase family 39 protein [Elusimicrobiota bacterium]